MLVFRRPGPWMLGGGVCLLTLWGVSQPRRTKGFSKRSMNNKDQEQTSGTRSRWRCGIAFSIQGKTVFLLQVLDDWSMSLAPWINNVGDMGATHAMGERQCPKTIGDCCTVCLIVSRPFAWVVASFANLRMWFTKLLRILLKKVEVRGSQNDDAFGDWDFSPTSSTNPCHRWTRSLIRR